MEPKQKSNETTKNKRRDLIEETVPGHDTMESVLRKEESLWLEGFVKRVGF